MIFEVRRVGMTLSFHAGPSGLGLLIGHSFPDLTVVAISCRHFVAIATRLRGCCNPACWAIDDFVDSILRHSGHVCLVLGLHVTIGISVEEGTIQ